MKEDKSSRREGDENSRRSCGGGGADDARGTRGKRETCRRHTMQVTARAPHRPCLISFVPGVSSAFFPMTARQPWCGSAWLGSSRLVSSRVVSALCRTEIAQMETSVSFSLRSPVTLLAFSLSLSFSSSSSRFLLFSVLSSFICRVSCSFKGRVLDSYFTSLLMLLRVKFATSWRIYAKCQT